ncbi:MAG: type II toxin-antitoxin system HicA family toxin [Dehalococcoidales bacterium]|jgi:predicted RNA binding protein YcfA (HicA-like mRNA interferase family)|nr:type II toxin-antitoxin system HicA family toxin [Dehalococcoidales bacterium]MDD4794519.1 type II toxin-antitoxin system HicA family toxin [Dehalococcoidales bacterium]MDD5122356.1 type II toxin-antitoxin system HicA family toxin [Dehalococcoidales bacterium]MDX9777080.1 type II toxin-antitoxin system HicA family toxin [Petrimonas sp.]
MGYTSLPAITGRQLIRLLQKDGWIVGRKANHGRTLFKDCSGRKIVTFVPEKSANLPDVTLSQILGTKQTGLGKKGLLELLNKYGL